MMQRWRLEIQAIADELSFPDDADPDEVQRAIEVRMREMCDGAPAFYWRIPSSKGVPPTPKRFR
jgi:hypothetical protein